MTPLLVAENETVRRKVSRKLNVEVPNFKEPNMRRNPCLPSKFQKLHEREGKKVFSNLCRCAKLNWIWPYHTTRRERAATKKFQFSPKKKKIKEALKIELGIFEKRESAACVLLLI